MSHAKVKNNLMVKYPYTVTDFLSENPNNYSPKVSLNLAYEGTEDQSETGCSVVLVPVQAISDQDYNRNTHFIFVEDTPTYKDGVWIRPSSIKELSEEEKLVATMPG